MLATRAQVANAEAQLKEAEVRLGYTNIYAPVTGTVSVRAARQGEVVNIGAPIVTIVDLSDTWVRAAIPETYADHIGYGDLLRVRARPDRAAPAAGGAREEPAPPTGRGGSFPSTWQRPGASQALPWS